MTLPPTKDPAKRLPLLAQPWEGGVIGWIVVVGALIAELVGGLVTNQMPMVIAAPVLIVPVAVAAGFAIVQWWEVRSSGAGRASWWHMAGIAAALFTWLVFPTTPGILVTDSNARAACYSLYQPTPACLSRAAQAMDNHDLVWWLTGALILAAALLIRLILLPLYAYLPAEALDEYAWERWMRAIHEHGLLNIFRTSAAELAGYQWVLWLLSLVYGWFGGVYVEYQPHAGQYGAFPLGLHVLMKLPPLVFDMALIGCVYATTNWLVRDAESRPGSPTAVRLPARHDQATIIPVFAP